MIRYLRSHWITTTIGILVIVGGYWYFFGRTASNTANTQKISTVTLGSIRSSVKSTGKISPVQTTNLSFSKQGVIQKIYKTIGEKVSAGDVIAEIDAKSAYLDIESAQLGLSNAENNYKKLYSSTTKSDMIRAENTYTESINQLTKLETEYENLIISQKNNLSQSTDNLALLEDKLALAKSELTYTIQNTTTDTSSNNLEKDVENAFLTLEDIERMIPPIIKEFKENSLIEDKTNIRYGDLSAKDPSIKTQTESTYASVILKISSYSKNLTTLRNTSVHSFDDTLSLLTDARTMLGELLTLSTLITSEYTNSIESNYLRNTDIDTIKTSTRTRGSEISSKISTVNSTLSTLKTYGSDALEELADKNTITTKEQSVKSAENEVSRARAALEELRKTQSLEKKTKQDAIESQKNTIALNNATYKELVAGPESTEITSAKNSIASANISVEKAKLTLKDYQIIAPFDGVVNDIPWNIGDTTESTEGILIENKDAYEIALSLDQVDIVKIHKGMRANIILDAFPTETYTGSVSRISEVPTETSGVVSYEAIVTVTIPRTDIYSKMSVTVEVITSEKTDILTLPTSAIITENGKSYVNKVTDTKNIVSQLPMRTFSGRARDMIGSGVNLAASGMRMKAGELVSGETFSGNVRTVSGGRMRNTPNTNISPTKDVPYEKIEISIGESSDGKTEILSGLKIGDMVVILTSGTNTSTSSTTSRSSSRNSGFGGPPPGGF